MSPAEYRDDCAQTRLSFVPAPKESFTGSLLTRLREMFPDIPESATIRSLHSGRRALSNGAWSWYLWCPTKQPNPYHKRLGSYYTVKQLAYWAECDIESDFAIADRAYPGCQEISIYPKRKIDLQRADYHIREGAIHV